MKRTHRLVRLLAALVALGGSAFLGVSRSREADHAAGPQVNAAARFTTPSRYSAPIVPQGKYRVAFRSALAPEGYGQPSGPVDSRFGEPKQRNREKKDAIPEKYQGPSFPVE